MVQRVPKFLGGIDADMSDVWNYANDTLQIDKETHLAGNVMIDGETYLSAAITANVLVITDEFQALGNVAMSVDNLSVAGQTVIYEANGNAHISAANIEINGKTVLYDGMDLGSIA